MRGGTTDKCRELLQSPKKEMEGSSEMGAILSVLNDCEKFAMKSSKKLSEYIQHLESVGDLLKPINKTIKRIITECTSISLDLFVCDQAGKTNKQEIEETNQTSTESEEDKETLEAGDNPQRRGEASQRKGNDSRSKKDPKGKSGSSSMILTEDEDYEETLLKKRPCTGHSSEKGKAFRLKRKQESNKRNKASGFQRNKKQEDPQSHFGEENQAKGPKFDS